MMDENKILELLAEYLRKTDQILERLAQHDLLWSKNNERWGKQEEHWNKQDVRLDIAYQTLIFHSEKIEALQKSSEEIRKQTKKIEVRNDAMLQQLIALSKRVNTIERKR